MHDDGGHAGMHQHLIMSCNVWNNICCRFLPNNPHTYPGIIYTGDTIFSLSITWAVWVHNSNAVSAEYSGAVDTCILNIERDGGILFSWKVSPQWQRFMLSVFLCWIYSWSEDSHSNPYSFSALSNVWLCCSLHWYHIFSLSFPCGVHCVVGFMFNTQNVSPCLSFHPSNVNLSSVYTFAYLV